MRSRKKKNKYKVFSPYSGQCIFNLTLGKDGKITHYHYLKRCLVKVLVMYLGIVRVLCLYLLKMKTSDFNDAIFSFDRFFIFVQKHSYICSKNCQS